MAEADQAKEIRRLLDAEHKKASPFDILSLDITTCELADVNRSFRKIALLLHPDKCKLPQCSAAFHVAERAHKMLSQETVLAHLRRADAKKREREAETPTETYIPKGRMPASSSSSMAVLSTTLAAAAAAAPPAISFGSLSKLATSGISNDEQKAAEISRILACKPTDYFIILDVNPEEAEVAHVDRRYRRIAQALHPDKCSLPRVNDAFTVVDKAHKELADEKKLIRFRLAFQQQRKREAALQAEAARRAASDDGGGVPSSFAAGMSAAERLAVRRQEMLREQQLQAARLADEAARKRQRQEREEVEKAGLAAELERQRKEWRDMQML